MNKTNQYWVKVQYVNQPIEIVEIWADNERNARRKAHDLALSKIEVQCETPEQTAARQKMAKYDALSREYDKLEGQMHEWPEYMDDTEEDRAARKANYAHLESLAEQMRSFNG